MPTVDYLEKIIEQIAYEIAYREGLTIADRPVFLKEVRDAVLSTVRRELTIGALKAKKILADPEESE